MDPVELAPGDRGHEQAPPDSMPLPGIGHRDGHLHLVDAAGFQAQVADDGRAGRARLIHDRHEPLPVFMVWATEECRGTIGDPCARAVEPQ